MIDSAGVSFGERLRRLREAAGLSQEELAQRAGMTRKGVGAIERGERQRPYPHTVRALAAALGLSQEEMAALASSAHPRRVSEAAPVPGQPASLPTPLTAIVGREGEVARILDQLGAGERLLTLTGPGGVGKTRLAIEVGHRLGTSHPGEPAFVPLAQIGDSALLPDSIAHALGLREAAGTNPWEVLLAALRDRRILLILDNFEHLIDAAPLVAEMLERCPGVSALVTSRSPLRIRGEREFPVRPLALPDRMDPPPDTLARVPAVELFSLRAQAVAPGFQLTEANAGAVADICRRLDGLPLAIELAAARIRMLSPEQLLARLHPLLPMLATGARDLPERQRTMEATVRWSYDLLDPAEQELFRDVSVFAGEWMLDGAQAVSPGMNVLEPLGSLVEKSLAVPETERDRYRLLEPIRQFASGALDARPEAPAVHDRHARYVLTIAEEAAPRLKGHEQERWLQRLDQEHDDFRAALSWLLRQVNHRTPARAEMGLRLAAALSRYWYMRGHWSEGLGWIDSALAATEPVPSLPRAAALDGAGMITLFQNDYSRATRFLQDSVEISRELGDPTGMVASLTKLGFIASFENDLARAEKLRDAIAPLEPDVDDAGTVGYLRIFHGLIAVLQGDIAAAIELHRQGLTIFRQTADLHGLVWSQTNLGLLELVRGDMDAAAAVLGENLVLAVRLGEPASINYALLGLAAAAAHGGDPARAARLWGAAETVRSTAGMALSPLAQAQTQYGTWVARARTALGEESLDALWAEGRAMRLNEAVTTALAPPPRA